jgi:hypothetical protein
MMGLLIPLNINTMSVYSFSMQLYIAGNFTHYRYQMDDIIYTLNAMTATRKRVAIRLIPLPVLSGPTSGATVHEELQEWYLQARRWTIGAAEVFHYFFTKLVFSRAFDWYSGICYGLVFLHYYGYVLCASSLFGLVAVAAQGLGLSQCPATAIGASFAAGSGVLPLLQSLWANVPLFALISSCVLLCFCMILDRVAVAKVLKVEESISKSRAALHVVVDSIMAYPTLIGYSCVEFAAVLELCIKGKSVCNHNPSLKNSLSVPAAPPAGAAAKASGKKEEVLALPTKPLEKNPSIASSLHSTTSLGSSASAAADVEIMITGLQGGIISFKEDV